MRKIAVLVVSVMVLGFVQSLPVWSGVNEPEGFGVLPNVAGVVFGSLAGFFAGGLLGGVVGGSFMVVINPLRGCGCEQDIGDPIVY